MDRRLQESNMHKKMDGIDETIKHLNILKEAWSEMLSKQDMSNVPSQVQAVSLSITG